MASKRWAAARDLNEAAIVDELRRIPGVHVELIDTPCDALIGWRNRVYLFEFKATKGKLTPEQERFHSEWGSMVTIVRTLDDALEALGIGVQR